MKMSPRRIEEIVAEWFTDLTNRALGAGAIRQALREATHQTLPVIYVAGRFRGSTTWRVEQNVRHAETHSLKVWKAGAVALCPHTNTRFFDKEAPDEIWLDGTMELLRRSDAIYLIPGWQRSSGARTELREARKLGLVVLKSEREMAIWVRKTKASIKQEQSYETQPSTYGGRWWRATKRASVVKAIAASASRSSLATRKRNRA